jgi:hypothetical protein
VKNVILIGLAGNVGKPGNLAAGLAKANDFKVFPAEAAQNSIFPSRSFEYSWKQAVGVESAASLNRVAPDCQGQGNAPNPEAGNYWI